MPRGENLEVVRAIFRDWERGDVSTADWADPDIEFVAPDGPETRTVNGLAGMAAGMRDFLGAWTDWRVEADEYRELDDERVLVLQHYSARGRSSGVQIRQAPGANLFHLRDGRVTRLVCYLDRGVALDELGLTG